MSDDDLIRRGDAKLVAEHQDEGWHDGISVDYHPYTKAEFAKHIAQAIAALPAVTPAPGPGVTAGAVEPVITRLTIEPDMSKVREMLDDAEAKWAHLDTIAATIRVNTLRHGGTHEQADAFVRGEGDFIGWLSTKLQPANATHPTALDDPKVRKLVEALVEIEGSAAPDHHVPQYQHCIDVARAALRDMEGA